MVAQSHEERILSVDLRQGLPPNVSPNLGKESRRANAPGMVHEHEAIASVDGSLGQAQTRAHARRPRHGSHGARRRAGTALGLAGHDESSEVLCLGQLDDVGRALGKAMELPENILELSRRETGEPSAAADRNEEENFPKGDPLPGDQPFHLVVIIEVPSAEAGVDLGRQSQLAAPPQPLHGAVEASGRLAKVVVGRRIRGVKAEGGLFQAGRLQGSKTFLRERRCRRRDGADAQPASATVADQILQVTSVKRVPAGEDQDRSAHIRHLLHEAHALLGGKLAWIAREIGVGSAMDAGERAGPRRLPDDQQGSSRKIERGDCLRRVVHFLTK